MQEKTLLKISVIVMTLGLLFLFFYAGDLQLDTVRDLDTAQPEEKITIKGVITKMSVQDKVVFLTIEGEKVATADVVVFSQEDLFLKEGANVEVSGLVEEYKGKKEIIAQEVVLK